MFEGRSGLVLRFRGCSGLIAGDDLWTVPRPWVLWPFQAALLGWLGS